MRLMAAAIAAICVCIPSVTAGQTFVPAASPADAERESRQHMSVQVAAGPALMGEATSVSAAFGYAPTSWLELLVSAERIHAPTETSGYPNGYIVSRGGTMTFVSGELRLVPLPKARVSPFAIAGVGGGISRPNVNTAFPDAVTNELRIAYLGGGVRVPVGRGFSLLGDARAMAALDGYDSVLGVWTVRGGIAWRF